MPKPPVQPSKMLPATQNKPTLLSLEKASSPLEEAFLLSEDTSESRYTCKKPLTSAIRRA